jgi:hypothetical protein
VLGEKLRMLDDQFLELLDLVAFETSVPAHALFSPDLRRSSCSLRGPNEGR